VILGFGINHFARGGNSASTAPQQPLTNAAQTPAVTYKKIVTQSFVPHLPVETQTMQVWSSSVTPDVARAIETIRGRRFEFGLVYEHDKVLGVPERKLVYYYDDAPTDTIYQIGSTPAKWVAGTLPPLPPPGQILKQVLAKPFARLEGTRTYEGRSVDVVVIHDPHDPAVTKQTLYLDKRTHEIVRSDLVFQPENSPPRVLDRAQQRTLPSTKANLALTSLQAAHPGARIAREAPPRFRQLLPYIDSDAYIEMMMR
jgi:hypothetical protein